MEQAIRALRDSEDLMDVKVKCGDHSFKAHSVVIGARSVYFLHECRRQKDEFNKQIHIQDSDPRVVAALLQYLYEDDYNFKPLSDEQPMGQEQKTFLLTKLNDVKRRRYAEPFLDPVDPAFDGTPDYLEIIKKPMDLGTLEQRIVAGEYTYVLEFCEDFDLIYMNSLEYNGDDHAVTKRAIQLSAYFERAMAWYPADESADNGIGTDETILHMSVWLAATKFEIPGLADLAHGRAKHSIEQQWNSDTFSSVVEAVYQSPEDPLRAAVIKTVQAHRSQLFREGQPLRKLLRTIPGFAADVLETEVDGRRGSSSNRPGRDQGRQRSRSPRRSARPRDGPTSYAEPRRSR